MQALKYPDVTARLTTEGAVPVGNSASEFGVYIRSELVRWARIVKISVAAAQ